MQLLGENVKRRKHKKHGKNQPQMPVAAGIDAKCDILHGPYFRVYYARKTIHKGNGVS